ncbi:galanin [Photobacterium angustum]|uniref:DUF3137 domain-containing protein n=1 Tax=Photobacterium angustum TaxID=661 RepID=A0ABX5GZ22_PHOAN|nr:DUF3137 domain-containing protein [Photobacterium angustum]KJG40699.1 galanin [Photobacterium angustum]PSX03599.1 DUF3137 domain-containing protein [Photobacterium angustum]
MEDRISALYEQKLRSQLSSLESTRLHVVKQLWIALAVGGITAAIAIPTALHFNALPFGIIATFIVAIFMLVRFSKQKQQYCVNYKQKVITALLANINESFYYQPLGSISEQDYKASQLFPQRYDSFRGEDFVQGTIGKTTLRFSELETQVKKQRVNQKESREEWETIFRGILFIADANKHFNSQTLILPAKNAVISAIGDAVSHLFNRENKRVALENPHFEQYFSVYSNDQIEARYLLTPAMMERLVDFVTKAKNRISLSFIDNNVFIAMSSHKNYFEPALFTSSDSLESVQAIAQDLQFVIDIVSDLDLNTRIWTKR